jgi:formylglycine-generating enzyme required for sulfatase activity
VPEAQAAEVVHSFGNNPAGLTDHALYEKNSSDETRTVGGKTPNPWGLHDMSGN